MSSNTSLKLSSVGTAKKAGRAIAISAATETQVWRRSEEMAKQAAAGLKEAVEEDINSLPAKTAEVVMRETQYQSPADGRMYYTHC